MRKYNICAKACYIAHTSIFPIISGYLGLSHRKRHENERDIDLIERGIYPLQETYTVLGILI
jgi:hypothetical protein